MIMASSSAPGVYSGTRYDGKVFIDGGVVWNTNLVSAVEKCLEVVEDKSQIVMDIIVCYHAEIEEIPIIGTTLYNVMRLWNIY